MGVETMPKGANGDRALLKCDACATFLPSSWMTLYELTELSDGQFERTRLRPWSAARQVKMEVLGDRCSAQRYPPGSARLSVH